MMIARSTYDAKPAPDRCIRCRRIPKITAAFASIPCEFGPRPKRRFRQNPLHSVRTGIQEQLNSGCWQWVRRSWRKRHPR
eukprot:6212376-Pleurochrysis_carterae.AAC.1